MLESTKVVAALEVPPRHRPQSANAMRSVCPKLLRSPRWQGRSRCYRCTCRHGAHRAHRRRRRGHVIGRAFPFRVRSRSEATDSANSLPALPRLERASLSPQGAPRSSDSGASIGARVAQMCVGRPCTPTHVVWKGWPVRNLPDRHQQRGCARHECRQAFSLYLS
jgi:hypothetical protein